MNQKDQSRPAFEYVEELKVAVGYSVLAIRCTFWQLSGTSIML